MLHQWTRIHYPDLPAPWGLRQQASVILQPDHGSEGLCVTLLFSFPGFSRDASRPPMEKPDPSQISITLYRYDGSIVEPLPGQRFSFVFVGSGGVTGSACLHFPWGRDALDEGFVLLTMREHQYWLEIPYGFLRDPKLPFCADDPRTAPVFSPGESLIHERAIIVPWLYVENDVGEIQNGWRLSVNYANPFRASCALILYRADGPWEIFSPKTAVSLGTHYNPSTPGSCRSITLGDGDGQRVDRFSLWENAHHPGRRWGNLGIWIDEKQYVLLIPSSLFILHHGMVLFGDPRRIQIEDPLSNPPRWSLPEG